MTKQPSADKVETTARKKRKRVDPWGLLAAALFIVGLMTVAGFFGRFWWALDIASGLRFQYLQAALAAAAVYAVGRRKRQVAAALSIVLVNALFIVPMYFGRDTRATTSNCRMLLANVRSENTAYDRLLELVRIEKPDIIVLEEVNEQWIAALGQLREDYPQYLEYPEEDNFGIAFYTKLPVRSMEIKTIGEIQVASVHATVEHNGQLLNIIGTHPLPPGGKAYWQWRNDQLAELATYVRSLDGPIVVLGDLNVTPWSYYFAKFARDSQLRDGSKGFGLHISWPTFLPPLGIPIDHCLVSPAVSVCNRRTADRIGSDHYPVVVDIGRSSPGEKLTHTELHY